MNRWISNNFGNLVIWIGCVSLAGIVATALFSLGVLGPYFIWLFERDPVIGAILGAVFGAILVLLGFKVKVFSLQKLSATSMAILYCICAFMVVQIAFSAVFVFFAKDLLN